MPITDHRSHALKLSCEMMLPHLDIMCFVFEKTLKHLVFHCFSLKHKINGIPYFLIDLKNKDPQDKYIRNSFIIGGFDAQGG